MELSACALPKRLQQTKSTQWVRDKTSLRRDRFLQQQAKVRDAFFEQLRERALKVLQHTEDLEITDNGKQKVGQRIKRRDQRFREVGKEVAQQLVIPDFLVDVPAMLGTEWLAYQRPDGPRVVLVASAGRCCVYSKSGAFLTEFPTALPRNGCTILDGVLCLPTDLITVKTTDEAPQSPSKCLRFPQNSFRLVQGAWFAVVDCLCWGDCALGNLPAECRRFILSSRLDELEPQLTTVSKTNKHILRLIDVVDATAKHLNALYHSRAHVFPNTLPDSIVFVHKEALYLPGLSPLYLCWRDSHLSRFPIDTTDGKEIPERQLSNLWLQLRDGALRTEDSVTVARIEPDSIAERLEPLSDTVYLKMWRKGKVKDRLLVRVDFERLDLKANPDLSSAGLAETAFSRDNTASLDAQLLVDVNIVGTPSPKRNTAESLNRLIHQFLLREQHRERQTSWSSTSWLKFEDILMCAATGAPNYTMMLLQGTTHLERFIELEQKPEEDGDGTAEEEYCGDFNEEDTWRGW